LAFRRRGEAADLADELHRRGAHFFIGAGGSKLNSEFRHDIPTHL
jgi:hypothetical protein